MHGGDVTCSVTRSEVPELEFEPRQFGAGAPAFNLNVLASSSLIVKIPTPCWTPEVPLVFGRQLGG